MDSEDGAAQLEAAVAARHEGAGTKARRSHPDHDKVERTLNTGTRAVELRTRVKVADAEAEGTREAGFPVHDAGLGSYDCIVDMARVLGEAYTPSKKGISLRRQMRFARRLRMRRTGMVSVRGMLHLG